MTIDTPDLPGFTPRPGALCYRDEGGTWRASNPRDVMFSTVTMLATHYWDDRRGKWISIWEDATLC